MTSVSMTQLLAAASLPLESNSETDYEYEHDPAVGSSVPASGVQLRQTMTMSMTQLLAAVFLPL